MYGGKELSRLPFVADTSVRLLEAVMQGSAQRIGTSNLEWHVEGSLSAANDLWDALQQEFEEKKEPEPEEVEPNENGDVMVYITPKTACCSEIAKALSEYVAYPHGNLSTRKISNLIKRAGICSSGFVVWKLTDGTMAESKSYGVLEWKHIRDAAIREGLIHQSPAITPPARLLDDEGDE